MREETYCIAKAASAPGKEGEIVSIYVDGRHPLLQLKRALPWPAIREVMVRWWRAAGKNVDGRPGQSWPVSLYVPLVVLMVVKHFNSREMEAYLAENVVARVFIGCQDQLKPQIRDHANIARALGALGAEGVEEVNRLVVREAARLGFGDASRLSGDTTAQELPIGYPNEPGILRGVAQRCGRALRRLKEKGVGVVETAVEQGKAVVETALRRGQQVIGSVKEYHLFAKGKEEKQQSLERIIEQTERLMEATGQVVEQINEKGNRVRRSAKERLQQMRAVVSVLIPQIQHWMRTGQVAAGKILHAGITQAKAIVRHKAGKKVEFGLPYLINRIGGGYVFGVLLNQCPDESKMPLLSLKEYRKIFGPEATPELITYDRGGHAKGTVEKLEQAGVKKVGIQPKGKAGWSVAEADRATVKSERAKMEGSIGTLKTEKYGFNKPRERQWEQLRAAGPRSLLSMNLNKLMRDVVNAKKEAALVSV